MKIIKFSSKFCGPCKIYSSVFDRVVNKFKEFYSDVDVIEVDIDEQPEVAAEYNILSIPTTLIYDKNETLRFSKHGSISEQELKSVLQSIQLKEENYAKQQ